MNVADLYNKADKDLKQKVNEVEEQLKQSKRDKVQEYFNELVEFEGIHFITIEDVDLNINLSISLKKLKEQTLAYVRKIVNDLELIETQEHKEQIIVEYKRTLNISQSIITIQKRVEAETAERERRAELKRKKQEEAERVKCVQEESSALLAPREEEELKGTDFNEATPEETEPAMTVAFKVTATLNELKKLKAFLIEGGYKYE
jgi:hypothetical protein